MFYFFFFGCQETPTPKTKALPETPVLYPHIEDGEVLQEVLFTATQADTLLSHTQFFSVDGVVYEAHETGFQESLRTGEHVQAHRFQEREFLSIDGTIYTRVAGMDWSEVFFNDVTGHTTAYMFNVDQTLFLGGASRLFYWQDDTVNEFALTDKSILQATGNDTTLYLRTPHLFAYDWEEKDLVRLIDAPIQSIAVDGFGDLWFSKASLLHRLSDTGEYITYELPDSIVSLHTNPQGDGLWIRTEEDAFFFRDGFQRLTNLPEGDWLDVDTHNRLLIHVDGQVHRVSVDRPVVIWGLLPMQAITTRQSLTLLPTRPEDVTELQVFVDNKEISVEPEDWVFELDPDTIAMGLNHLNLVVHTENGSDLHVHPFINQELPAVSWAEEISPLHEERCAECHGGATETVLVEKSDWMHHIDTIIDVVSAQTMPLGSESLSEEEITKIRAWKQGGFQ
ncbi:MAG: hypothetical protein VX278_12590 [Myxococcota bacterium]|nr:hypothetical protein [Myxococcota bacterium]